MALRGLGKAAGREELEEAEGLRADCGDEEEAEVELTTGESEVEYEDGDVIGGAVIGAIVMCGAGRSFS